MKLKQIQSSMINHAGYSRKDKTLQLVYISGSVYNYNNVGEKVYKGLLTTKLKGKYIHSVILNKYKYTQV